MHGRLFSFNQQSLFFISKTRSRIEIPYWYSCAEKKKLKIFVKVLLFGTLAGLFVRNKTVKIIHIIQIFFNTRIRIYILGTVKPNAIYLIFSNTYQSHDYNL